MDDLSAIQRRIWQFIHDEVVAKGYPPTLREIGDAFSITSTNGVRYHLRVMTEKKYLSHRKGSRRGLQLRMPNGRSPFKNHLNDSDPVRLPLEGMGPGSRTAQQEESHRLPVVGRVAAGAPILAPENLEEELEINPVVFGGSTSDPHFALRVSGDSMVEVGIMDGDMAVVRKQPQAKRGDIVVALVNDEATIKRYLPGDGEIVLKAENSAYAPIVVTPEDRFAIAGVLVGIVRRNLG